MIELSIVVPTFNRKGLLEVTLDSIIAQLDDSQVSFELLVTDNASSDGTSELFEDGAKYHSIARYARYDNRVGIDESFVRAVSETKGRFVLLFGDDDIPLPGFLRELTSCLAANAEIGFFYVNRIIGNQNLEYTTEVPHAKSPFGRMFMPLSDFIRIFTHWPGFVTCLVFSREAWDLGKPYSMGFDGYNFLSRVYHGSANKETCFIASPLVLQRRGIQSWKKHWVTYWLVSMPKMLTSLEACGVTTGALTNWQEREVTNRRFIIDCFVAKAYNYSFRSSFWSDMRKFQVSRFRLTVSYFFQYLLPVAFARFLYSKTDKMT